MIDIQREGLTALKKRLSRADMVRFLQMFGLGSGDYATQRHKWADETTLKDIKKAASAKQKYPRRRAN
jgi:hypothetical protein